MARRNTRPELVRRLRALALALVAGLGPAAHAASCPPPPPCAPPVGATCEGVTETTITESTVTCYGSAASVTMTVEETVGPADICVGAEKSVGFHVCPGTVNSDFSTETVLDVGKIFADGFEQP